MAKSKLDKKIIRKTRRLAKRSNGTNLDLDTALNQYSLERTEILSDWMECLRLIEEATTPCREEFDCDMFPCWSVDFNPTEERISQITRQLTDELAKRKKGLEPICVNLLLK